MPSRILREDILTSERVDQLPESAEVFYRRLMSKVDDFGLYDARPSILRASLYPLRLDRVREADISRSLASCQGAGLLALYQCDGKPYLQMLNTKWTARSEPKFPLPPTTENGCAQLLTPVPVFVDVVVVEEKKARKRAFDASAIDLPQWLDRAVWVQWVEDRKARNKPITEAGAAAQLKQLDGYKKQGHTAQSVIEHSIASGYQGLFAPANNRPQAASAAPNHDAEKTTAYLASQSLTPEEIAAANEARRRVVPALKRVSA